MTTSTILRISGFALAIVALLASPAVAQSPTEATGHHGDHGIAGDDLDDATAFHHMVRGIDVLPNRATMEERWPDALQRLIAFALDEDVPEYERWRATSLLTNFPESEAQDALLKLTDTEEPRIRSMAYYVLGTTFLEDGDDALLAELKTGLDDDEERVRADVVRSFGWTNNEDAHQILRDIATGDRQDDLQPIAERSLQRLAD